MISAVYILIIVTFGMCAALLLRGYKQNAQRLLLWSGLCFLILCVSNILTFIDLVLLPSTIDLYTLRLVAAAIAMGLLLFGLIWESDRVQ